MDEIFKKKQYTLKNYFAILITIIVLAVSFTYFPWAGTAYGFGGISRESFIITCIFVSVWLVVLVLAAILKSNMLIDAHLAYWLVVLGVYVFILVTRDISVLQVLTFILFIWFLAPIIGIVYQFPYIPTILEPIIPACMVLLGFITNVVFLRKSSAKQSID